MKKFMKWKILIITCLVCLLPIVAGMALWDRLPDTIAVHFDINNNPDGFASKAFTVFGLPCLMVALQIICCIINDVKAKQYGDRKKFEMVTKWIIPIMAMLLQALTLGYALGISVDIRRMVVVIVGLVLIIIGNYLPKFDYVKNVKIDTEKARKINRFIGFGSVVMGLLAILTAFLPPITSVMWLFLLIPYAALMVVYTVVVIKKK